MNRNQKTLLAAAGVGVSLAGSLIFRNKNANLRGRVVLITGGSRGLGLALAREFAGEGARIVICARDDRELARAQQDLESRGAEVMALRCDVANKGSVDETIREASERFGPIDVLVNNAGVMQVGPVESMTLEDFEQAMNVMFWGVVYPTLAVLENMVGRRSGRIVNITSIAGKVSVPHMMPYNCAKFAAVGFSEGLRAELSGKGVSVTTIAPGLMRTGSYLNALFKGQEEDEAAWFSLSASRPLVSISAERAAKQIVEATRTGQSERILTAPAKVLARAHGVAPGVTADILGMVARVLLPEAIKATRRSRGRRLPRLQLPWMRIALFLGRRAARRLMQPAAARA
jgi:NAD(P)-dependent dehydrogenase (short-subunit alcohol dehydrogenase family)